jgi:hypothetical protein
MKIKTSKKKIAGYKIGLDLEALPDPTGTWYGAAKHKLAVCIGYGVPNDLHYIEALDRRPGIFSAGDLLEVREAIIGNVVVAHNASYDIGLLNGLLGEHPDLGTNYELPPLFVLDTMGNYKWGGVARNGLSERCDRANRLGWQIKAKIGSPNWKRIAQGDKEEWAIMKEYNLTDVECALGLEKFYRECETEKTIKIKLWSP